MFMKWNISIQHRNGNQKLGNYDNLVKVLTT